jgi:hypothetical protein
MILLSLLFYIPFRTCFYWTTVPSSTIFTYIEQSTDAVFVIDIFLNFLTALENPDKDEFVVDLPSIAKNYLLGHFTFDLIASIPFQWIVQHSPLSVVNNVGKVAKFPKLVKTIKALKLLKLMRATKLSLYIEKIESECRIQRGLSKFFTNLIIIFLIAHFTGCLWYLVGANTNGWIHHYGYNSTSISAQYIASIYWAVSTLTTVGYGDITGQTPQEQLYSMLITLVGATCFAFIIGSLTAVVSSNHEHDQTDINLFIKTAKIPNPLAKQIRTYFDYKVSRCQKQLTAKYYGAEELLFQMPSGLRSEILVFLEKGTVDRIELFQNKTLQFIADTVSMLQSVVAYDGEHIIEEGSTAHEM